MMKSPIRDATLFLLLTLACQFSAGLSFANPRIDRSKVLFGIEYTFQDQGMVNEPGRTTFETPHKRERFEKFRAAYLKALKLGPEAIGNYGSQDFKPGSTIEVPGDGQHVMNMEPVTIEVNTTPRKVDEIEATAAKIYSAASEAQLVPYIKPAAERSGMGHVHVGAATIGESPFYQHPQLLRNLLVSFHKHPSLLWGFAEAYDIGDRSNIEAYHGEPRQQDFRKAIAEFDQWYANRIKYNQDVSDGFRVLLKALRSHGRKDFFEHYRFINIEHIGKIGLDKAIDPSTSGKLTVEFRTFRPPRTPAHAKAYADLLLALMEKYSEPGYLEPFEQVSPQEYKRFFTASKVAADWQQMKNELPAKSALWDEMINEYVNVQHGARIVKTVLGENTPVEIFPAYSEKGKKGTYYELRIPAEGRPAAPIIQMQNKKLAFESVQLNGKSYWITQFEAGFDSQDEDGSSYFSDPAYCNRMFGIINPSPRLGP
jgi:hypothetical protein